MGVCRKCLYFRPVKPASQLLARAISTTDAEVSKALIKIQDDEAQQRGYEAQTRAKREQASDLQWGFRPLMSDYCGLSEANDTFLVAELKNAGARCSDYKEGTAERHDCANCAHRVIGKGGSADRSTEIDLSRMAAQNVVTGSSTSTSDNLLNKHREGAATRKAFELQAVYSAKGRVPDVPLYFDHCASLSNADTYVVCSMENPHHTCTAWEKGEPARIEEHAGASAEMSPPPAAPLRVAASQTTAAGIEADAEAVRPEPQIRSRRRQRARAGREEECTAESPRTPLVRFHELVAGRRLTSAELRELEAAQSAALADGGESALHVINTIPYVVYNYENLPPGAREQWFEQQVMPSLVANLPRYPGPIFDLERRLCQGRLGGVATPMGMSGGAASPDQFVPEVYQGSEPSEAAMVAASNADRYVLFVQNQIAQAERKGDTARIAQLQLELQKAMNASQSRNQLASNMMKMTHESIMNSIHNMK